MVFSPKRGVVYPWAPCGRKHTSFGPQLGRFGELMFVPCLCSGSLLADPPATEARQHLMEALEKAPQTPDVLGSAHVVQARHTSRCEHGPGVFMSEHAPRNGGGGGGEALETSSIITLGRVCLWTDAPKLIQHHPSKHLLRAFLREFRPRAAELDQILPTCAIANLCGHNLPTSTARTGQLWPTSFQIRSSSAARG